MFDISFSELLVIALVALVVIGPEKLPKVARTAGAFFGRLQRFVAQVKDEVNREARFAELQRLQDEVKSSLQQGVDEVERSILPDVTDQLTEPEVIEHAVPPSKAPSVKKTRKSAQAQSAPVQSVQQESTLKPQASEDVAAVEPQAELFALADVSSNKPRKTRKTTAKKEDTDPVSEQTPRA